MSELRKYASDALFYFPLIEDGDADFVTDYTPAAGDAKIFTDQLMSTNPTALILGFDSLSELPAQGAQLDENGAGTAEGVVAFTVIVSGTVGGGDAAGFFFMRSVTGQAWSNDDQIDINGGNTNIATADSTTYDLAATAGLIAEIGNGMFAACLSPTEMTCAQGQIHIVDSATKAIEDQAIQFTTFGNASALMAFDLDTATQAVSLANGAITDASLAGNMEIVFETDFGTNYNTTRNAWVNNYTDIIGTMAAASFAADFITAAKIADNAFANEHFAAGALTAAEITGAAGCAVSSMGANVVTAAAIAAAAIDNATFAADVGSTAYATNIIALAVRKALDEINLDHILKIAVTGADVVDNTLWADLVSKEVTSDYDDYVNTTDSLQAIRDHIADGANLTEAGGDGDHLTAINLPNQTMDITGNLSGSVGSVTGAVGSVTGAVGSVTGNVGGNVTGSVGSNLELGPAEVNAEVVDVIKTDTKAELTAVPAANASLEDKVNWLFLLARNEGTQTSTTKTVFADDTTTTVATSTVNDDGTTFTRGEYT